MLVLLRVAVGWHFLFQGLHKYEDRDFSAAGYLKQSKGPLAPVFRGMIPDGDGRIRLNKTLIETEASKKRNDPKKKDTEWSVTPDSIFAQWEAFYGASVQHAQLDPAKQAGASKIYETHKRVVTEWFFENKDAILEYLRDLDELEADEADPHYRSIAYQQKRLWERRQKLAATVEPWLEHLDEATERFERELTRYETAQNPSIPPYQAPWSSMDWINKITIFTNLAIGVCLIAGLCTRLSSWGGAAFLLLIVLAQPAWPTIYPPAPPAVGPAWIVSKELIELLALALIGSTTLSGRAAGLDFFVYHFLVRPLFGPKTSENPAP